MTEKEFNEFLVREYLKHGSVDAVLEKHNHDIPVSYAGYQRVLDKWGIIKVAGPNSKITEAISFIFQLVEQSTTIESLYKKIPSSFQTSISTLYRIASYVKEGITRRVATALVLTSYGNQNKVLIAKDISTPRLELGKPFGSLSLPMGFSSKIDSNKESILRVLQQEVFTDFAVMGKIPNVIAEKINPYMYLDVLDIRVSVFQLHLPKKFSSKKAFSSYKLEDFRFVSVDQIINSKNNNYRTGVTEIILGYKRFNDYMKKNLVFNPIYSQSLLNQQLVDMEARYL